MAKLDFLFSVRLWETTSSISMMKMLAEQAETNVERAVAEACEPGASPKEFMRIIEKMSMENLTKLSGFITHADHVLALTMKK